MSDKPFGDLSVEELEKRVLYHNDRYWVQDAPEISDEEYDLLVRQLEKLAPDSPVLAIIGSGEVGGRGDFGNKVVHQRPMLSLGKCYTPGEFLDWVKMVALALKATLEADSSLERLKRTYPRILDAPGRNDAAEAALDEFVVAVTPKIDGVAASIRYDAEGRMEVASTRGDGAVGEDFTWNARLVQGIPVAIDKGPLEVRGEVHMRNSVFSSRYADEFSNPRNLTAGSLKQKEGNRAQAMDLTFHAYDLLGEEVPSEDKKAQRLRELGFLPVEATLVPAREVPSLYESLGQNRSNWDFDTDGIVIKLNDCTVHDLLGVTAHHPRYAIAYKFQGDTGLSTLQGVEWSVSRTGTITPVAHIEPVILSGASVAKCSLHNISIFNQHELKIGDLVQVTRRGGVIPNLEASLGGGTQTVMVPTICPACRAETLLAAPQTFVAGYRLHRRGDLEQLQAVVAERSRRRGDSLLETPLDTTNRLARRDGDTHFREHLTWPTRLQTEEERDQRRKRRRFLQDLPSLGAGDAATQLLLVFDPTLAASWSALLMALSVMEEESLQLQLLPTVTSRTGKGSDTSFGEAVQKEGLWSTLKASAPFEWPQRNHKQREPQWTEVFWETCREIAMKICDDTLLCSEPAACRGAVVGSIEHFLKGLGVDGFGHKIVESLFDSGLLTRRADVFGLQVEQLVELERMGTILATKLVESVQQARSTTVATFLQALGVPDLARQMSTQLEAKCASLKEILELDEEALLGEDSQGEPRFENVQFTTANNIVHGLRREKSEIDALLAEMTVTMPEVRKPPANGESSPMVGRSFVFTGKMSTLERKQAQKAVQEQGGETPPGVTLELDYLVVGDDGSPLFGAGKKGSKMLKAEKYNASGAAIRIISETDFLKMLEELDG